MHFYSSAHFKALHRASAPHKHAPLKRGNPLVGVRKQAVEIVEKLDDRTLRFTISTGAVDRDLDMIAVNGWSLDAFAKNPVVLWAHRADELPIGKAIDFGSDERRLFSSVRFLPGEGYGSASELAETVYRMSRDGYLSATSVGFRPLTWDFTDDVERGAEDWFPGIDFHTQELVELSLVSVPANPEALIEPGDFDNNTAPVVIPAPAQVLDYTRDRQRRRARAALVGVF